VGKNAAMARDQMDTYREALTAAIEKLVEAGRINDLSDWCRRAGFKSSTVHEFLSGRTRSLTLEKLDKLAAAAKIPISALIGETKMALNEEDVRFITALQRMSDDQKRQFLEWLTHSMDEENARKQ
jgi:transcriptional regulator with XRE-family HTH domain